MKTKEINAKLGAPDALPSVWAVQDQLGAKVKAQIRGFIAQDRAQKAKEISPLTDEARRMAQAHRRERVALASKQALRLQQENRERAARFRRGAGVVLDILTGRYFALRKQNESEAQQGRRRDVAEREQQSRAQLKERGTLQARIDALKLQHRRQRTALARDIVQAIRRVRSTPPVAQRQRERGPQLEL